MEREGITLQLGYHDTPECSLARASSDWVTNWLRRQGTQFVALPFHIEDDSLSHSLPSLPSEAQLLQAVKFSFRGLDTTKAGYSSQPCLRMHDASSMRVGDDW
jgi:hypothetical protein